MKRRANGEGTKPKKRKDGRWYAHVSIPRPEGGTQRVTVYGKTSANVVDGVRAEISRHADAGGYKKPDRKTLAAFLEQWLADVVQPTKRSETYRSYANAVHKHLIPALGHIPLHKLTPPMVARAVSGDPAHPMAATREKAYTVLSIALNVAVAWGLARVNVASAVPKPRVRKVEQKFFAPEEIGRLRTLMRGHRYEALIAFAVFTGLRPGEIFALQWSHLDLDAAIVRVEHTLDKVTFERNEPKSKRSRRTVDLSPTLVEELRAHRDRMKKERLSGFVFCDTTGKPLRLSNFTRRVWKPLLVEAWGGRYERRPKKGGGTYAVAVPDRDYTLYALRHTAAALMIASGAHPKVLSERMGHASLAFTMDVYGHLFDTLGPATALALEQYLKIG